MPKKRTASGSRIAQTTRCIVCSRLLTPEARGKLYCSKRCKEVVNFADALEARVWDLVQDGVMGWGACRILRARLFALANRVPPPNLHMRGTNGRFR
jgi:phage FluMu protein Com